MYAWPGPYDMLGPAAPPTRVQRVLAVADAVAGVVAFGVAVAATHVTLVVVGFIANDLWRAHLGL